MRLTAHQRLARTHRIWAFDDAAKTFTDSEIGRKLGVSSRTVARERLNRTVEVVDKAPEGWAGVYKVGRLAGGSGEGVYKAISAGLVDVKITASSARVVVPYDRVRELRLDGAL